eukprot:1755916-Pyramimonas_sp.AAC.1
MLAGVAEGQIAPDEFFLLGNSTQWGPQAARYVHKAKYHYKVLAFSETHVDETRLADEEDVLRKGGWKLSATPALRKNT